MIKKTVAVVLSGGIGSRLWPVSTEETPKPFMVLSDGVTLLEKTYRRAAKIADVVATVTNQEYFLATKAQHDKVESSEKIYILEPVRRNTAPALGLAAMLLENKYGKDIAIIAMPADHLVTKNSKFGVTIEKAVELADDGYLVTVGIPPSYPETGYGYIKISDKFKNGYLVERFVEKPSFELACAYCESGQYLWNSGIFVFKPSIFLAEMRKSQREMYDALVRCVELASIDNTGTTFDIPQSLFEKIKSESVDFAIMEKSSSIAVIKAEFGWEDLGSWSSFSRIEESDSRGNVNIGDAIFTDSRDAFAYSKTKLIAVLGLNGVSIVEGDNAILVMANDRCQDLKELVSSIKNRGIDQPNQTKSGTRPWGKYMVLEQGNGYKIKKIVVDPGGSLSLQFHRFRSEHWVVVSGVATITNGDAIQNVLHANQSAYIPAGSVHRLENRDTKEPCVMIEVQCGSYLEEDDIVRLSDVYGRVNE